jgi:MOSC domain-containing protein YiiM
MYGAIAQINVSAGGILKRPIALAKVSTLGLEGDGHAHPKFHGGPLKALLLIGAESIEELNALGYELFPGALGENLTTSGLDRRLLRPGQRYGIGEVIIELTTIRRPCSAMEIYGPDLQAAVYDKIVKQGDPTSPRWGLSGFYAAVLQPGVIRPGDPIELRP